MNIVSWNVNGLRRLLDSTGQSLETLLDSLNGDIICLQETKLLRGRLDSDLIQLQKYWAFHNTSSARLGASGVSTFCRKATATPVAASLGFILKGYETADQDGRVIVTDHSEFLVMNAYFPTGAGSAQLMYKVWFMNMIQLTMEYFSAEEERGIVLVGDLGFALNEKDHYSPDSSNMETGMKVFNKHRGRTWLHSLLSSQLDLCCDVYRKYHPTTTGCYTYWRDSERREQNEGARVDYAIATKTLAEKFLVSCDIEPTVLGSDHCPIRLLTHIVQSTVPNEPPDSCAVAREDFEMDNTVRSLCNYFPQANAPEKSPFYSKQKRQADNSPAPGAPAASPADTDEATTNPGGFVCHHGEPAKITVVKKPGRNQGRPFYMCRRIPGDNKDPESRCDFFQWADTNACAKQCDCDKPAKLAPVKKEGRNKGRLFYSCARKGGKHCNFFVWVDEDKRNR